VTARICAAIVTAVTRTASAIEISSPAHRQACHMTALSRIHANADAEATAGTDSRVSMPFLVLNRRSQRSPPTHKAADGTSRAQAHPPMMSETTRGPSTAARATIARMSAPLNITVDAVAAEKGMRARRTTLVILRASPRRSGSTWFPASET
jgi:hypothetical protein